MLGDILKWFKSKETRRSEQDAGAVDSSFRTCERCRNRQVFHTTMVRWYSRVNWEATQLHLCEPCAKQELGENPGQLGRRSENLPDAQIELLIEKIVICEIHEQQAIYFREVMGSRRLPFILGIFEATAIDRILQGFEHPRPLTHDGWIASINALGARIDSMSMHWSEGYYLGTLRVIKDNDTVEVDIRPSDGVALALTTGRPILILEKVLAEFCLA